MSAYTYEPEAQAFTAMSMATLESGQRWRARVKRSDGTVVWFDGAYSDARKAKAQAGRVAARYRGYLEREGVCFYDRDAAAKAWTKAHAKVRKDTVAELHNAASQGASAAFKLEPEAEAREAAGYAADTAQGITWTQAYRLTKDRLADWNDENPEPPKP